MPTVCRSQLVSLPPAFMFAVVDDIEQYPAFLPWCQRACVHQRQANEVIASLVVAYGPIRKSFTTRNRLIGTERIDLSLLDGPFRDLYGSWRFEAVAGDQCRVSLDLMFQFSGKFFERIFAPIFIESANGMIDVFCNRAKTLAVAQGRLEDNAQG